MVGWQGLGSKDIERCTAEVAGVEQRKEVGLNQRCTTADVDDMCAAGEAFQGQAVYHDDVQDYSSNEPTMDGTASAILLWALCGSAP